MELAKVKFSFKATAKKDANDKPIKDAEGKIVKEKAADPVEVSIPLFNSAADILEICTKNDEKEVKLLIESMNNVIIEQAKESIDKDRELARASGINNDELSWTFIANLPPATRKGSAIPDETWDAFEEDYVSVIVHHGKTQAQAEMGAKFLKRKFYPVKDNKKVIEGLQKNLLVWAANTSMGEELSAVYEALMAKANALLAADEEVLLAAV